MHVRNEFEVSEVHLGEGFVPKDARIVDEHIDASPGLECFLYQRFYFLECSETDPSAAGAVAEGAGVNTAGNGAGASAEAMIEALAQGAASAPEAASGTPEYFDPYANCPVGQGGYPIVTEDCVSRY